MAAALRAECCICSVYVLLSDIRVLQCGHTLCADCLLRLKNEGPRRRLCPICRRSISGPTVERLPDGQPLYIDIVPVDSEAHAEFLESQIQRAADALDNIQISSSVKDVDKATNLLRGASKLQLVDGLSAAKITEALITLNARISPLLAELEGLREHYRDARAKMEALQDELCLKEDKIKRNVKYADDAVEAAAKAKKQFQICMEENSKLVKDLAAETEKYEKTKQTEQEMSTENKKLKGMVRRHKQDAIAERDKRKAAEKKVQELEEKAQSYRLDQEESLYILPQTNDGLQEQNLFEGSLEAWSDSPAKNTRIYPLENADTNLSTNRLEAAPRPAFASDWNLPSSKPSASGPRKRKADEVIDFAPETNRWPCPLKLDGQGRPKTAVQLGSRRKLER